MTHPAAPKHKTIRHYNTPHHAHYLTFSCFQRQQFLNRDRARSWFISAAQRAITLHDLALWAWVIMPEHVHLLFHPRPELYRMDQILISLKRPVTNKALRYVRAHAPAFLDRMRDRQPGGRTAHRFWQRGPGHDLNLWTGKYIWEKIHYIHMNPVRRGLVARPEDWAWSSAADYARARDVPLLAISFETLPRSGLR